MNRRLTWLLTVPLMVGSLLAGHAVAYWLVDASSGGHGYFHYVPLVGAVLLTLALCGWFSRPWPPSVAIAGSPLPRSRLPFCPLAHL